VKEKGKILHRPELIVMLTYADKTVNNALQLFKQCKDLPVTHWGFKDVGIPPQEMRKVVDAMNAVGKNTFLEVVSLTEEDGLRGANWPSNAVSIFSWARFFLIQLTIICRTNRSSTIRSPAMCTATQVF
jgi:hypothetical protein